MLRQTVMEGMRGPTMIEVRRTDRVRVLRVNHYLSDPRDVMWTLCSQQPSENYPDQGIEKGHHYNKKKRSAAEMERKEEAPEEEGKGSGP